jgi:hypothetical protein
MAHKHQEVQGGIPLASSGGGAPVVGEIREGRQWCGRTQMIISLPAVRKSKVRGEQRGEGSVFVLSKESQGGEWRGQRRRTSYTTVVPPGLQVQYQAFVTRVLLESETRNFSITFLFRDSRLFTNRLCILFARQRGVCSE